MQQGEFWTDTHRIQDGACLWRKGRGWRKEGVPFDRCCLETDRRPDTLQQRWVYSDQQRMAIRGLSHSRPRAGLPVARGGEHDYGGKGSWEGKSNNYSKLGVFPGLSLPQGSAAPGGESAPCWSPHSVSPRFLLINFSHSVHLL